MPRAPSTRVKKVVKETVFGNPTVKPKPKLTRVNSKIAKPKKSLTYRIKIKNAIIAIHDRKGATPQAIEKYLFANYGVVHLPSLKLALAKGLSSGWYTQAKGKRRFLLSASEKKDKRKAKKKKAKKPKKKKTTKKKSSKKSTTKKSKSTKKTDKKKTDKKKTDKKKKSTKEKKTTKVASTKKTKTPKEKTPKRAANVKAKATAPSRGVTKPKAAASSSATGSKEDLVWAWQYYDNGFHNYDSAASDAVEGVYQEYLTSPYTCDVRAVQSGQWQYEIDFRLMTQTNIQHENHTKRKIRRLQIPANEKGNRTINYRGTADEV